MPSHSVSSLLSSLGFGPETALAKILRREDLWEEQEVRNILLEVDVYNTSDSLLNQADFKLYGIH